MLALRNLKILAFAAIAAISMLAAEGDAPKPAGEPTTAAAASVPVAKDAAAKKTPPTLSDAQRATAWRAFSRFQAARATYSDLLGKKTEVERDFPNSKKELDDSKVSLQNTLGGFCGADFTWDENKDTGEPQCVEKPANPTQKTALAPPAPPAAEKDTPKPK